MGTPVGLSGGWLRIGAAAIALWGLGGCAYLTTYTRAIDLQKQSYAVDIKQRVVVSKEKDGGVKVVCAEPSPDALTTLSASAGADLLATLNTAGNKSLEGATEDERRDARAQANLAAALSEQGAFVGLRTQSIQLLRDAMYRLCEGYASGAIGASDFAAMQKRYQNTMLGLLAIEQLTRPVVAAQVALVSNASAASGQSAQDARVADLENKLDAVEVEVIQKRQAERAAGEALGIAERAHASKKAERDAAVNAARASETKRQSDAKETADPAKVTQAGLDAAKPFEAELGSLNSAEVEKKRLLTDAKDELAAAERKLARTQTALHQARGTATAAAGGAGQFGAIGGATASMTDSMGHHVTAIVTEVNKNYLLNDCLSFMIASADRQTKLAQSASIFSAQMANDEQKTAIRNALVQAVAQESTVSKACSDEIARSLAPRQGQGR
ncbi:hypothetical protein [uncultured Hydrogenophaga sp.]|uniref:hypothetical protein n=1 Tax=uncultured Hydrogenophaga sp. TaxID=199683 RepID=UPI00258BF285|nr:hypothetical protein [uncultured Hydrogenophaga sp.]